MGRPALRWWGELGSSECCEVGGRDCRLESQVYEEAHLNKMETAGACLAVRNSWMCIFVVSECFLLICDFINFIKLYVKLSILKTYWFGRKDEEMCIAIQRTM